jgi:hypothetical protein
VRERLQPLVTTAPIDEVIVGVPQLSVAVAVPGPGIDAGLQPRLPPAGQKVNTGGVVSTVQVTVRETGVALLPQASVAFQVLV